MLICADPSWLSLEKPSKNYSSKGIGAVDGYLAILLQQFWVPWVLPKLQQFPMPGIEPDLLKNKDADDDRNDVYDNV